MGGLKFPLASTPARQWAGHVVATGCYCELGISTRRALGLAFTAPPHLTVPSLWVSVPPRFLFPTHKPSLPTTFPASFVSP